MRLHAFAGHQMSLCARQQQITLLDTFLGFLVDQTLRPAQPAACASRFTACQQAKAEPECGPGGRPIFVRVQPRLIQTLLRRQHLLIACGNPADHASRYRSSAQSAEDLSAVANASKASFHS